MDFKSISSFKITHIMTFNPFKNKSKKEKSNFVYDTNNQEYLLIKTCLKCGYAIIVDVPNDEKCKKCKT